MDEYERKSAAGYGQGNGGNTEMDKDTVALLGGRAKQNSKTHHEAASDLRELKLIS